MTDTLLTFEAAGDWGNDIFGDTLPSCVHLMCIDPEATYNDDKVLGMTCAKDGMVNFVLREGDSETDQVNPSAYIHSSDMTLPFFSSGAYNLKVGKAYALKFKDATDVCTNFVDDDVDALEPQTLGIAHLEDGRSFVVYCDVSSGAALEAPGEASARQPAFEPIFFGSDEHELKDPRAAMDLWIATLTLTKLNKTGIGKTRYERMLEDGSWKPCNTYKEVIGAAENESGSDFKNDMRYHPDRYPSIQALGRSAFVRRRTEKNGGAKKQKAASG